MIAADRATAGSDPTRVSSDLLAIAALQDRVNSPRWSATAARALAGVVALAPDDPARVALVAQILPEPVADAPRIAGLLAEAVEPTQGADPLARARLLARLLAWAGRIDALHALIRDTDPAQRPAVALAGADALMSAGNMIAAYDLQTLVGTPEFRADLDETAVIMFLRQEMLVAAEAMAASAADPGVRAEALVRVALARARAGDAPAARALLAAAGPGNADTRFLPFARAEVFAHLGDRDAMEAELARQEDGLIQPRRLADLRAVATLVAGDGPGFLDQVAKSDTPMEARGRVKTAMLAALQSGASDQEPLLAALPPELLPFALNALGLHQAQTGAVDEARATLARLQALGPEVRVHGDFRAELARQELARGNARDAVAVAAGGTDPRLIAEMAAALTP